MDSVDFLFAFFVFVLLCLLILLYLKLKPNRKEDEVTSAKQQQLFRLYQNIEEMLNGVEDYVEDAKAGIAKDKEEAAETLAKILDLYQKANTEMIPNVTYEKTVAVKKAPKAKAKTEAENAIPEEKPSIPLHVNRNEQVHLLKMEGMEDDQIAKELGMSRTEIALILGIGKR